MKVRPERPRLSNWMHLMLPHQPRKHLLISQQTDDVSGASREAGNQPLCPLWPMQEWVQPGLTTAAQHHDLEPLALSRDGNIPGHPDGTAGNKNLQPVTQSPHQPKACRQHFWKYAQAGGPCLLV